MPRTIEDVDGYVIKVIDLYHRTTPEVARKILGSGTFESNCNSRTQAYFSSSPDGAHGRQYGEAVVHVEVPTWAAVEDERYRDGEVFYRVDLSELRSDRLLGAFTIAPDGKKSSIKLDPRPQLSERIAARAAALKDQAPLSQTSPVQSHKR